MSDDDYDSARAEEEIAAAWNQPAFSRETIETDQWTAVYLLIPENPTRELLEYAHGWAVDLERYAVHELQRAGQSVGAFSSPLGGPKADHLPEDHIEAARMRVETLGGMIGELALQEAAAVEPEKVEQARALLDGAGDMHSHYDVDWRNGEFAVVRTFEIDDNMLAEYGVPAEQEILRAPTIDALVDKVVTRFDLGREAEPANENTAAATIEAARIVAGNEEAAEIMPAQRVRGFISFLGSLENLASHAARAVDIALGAVIGYFVDEPKMTAAQVHQTLQAAGNVETIHAREVEAAAAVDAAEHEDRMLVTKGEQQGHDLRLAMTLGTNATAEANMGLDEHEASRRSLKMSR
jgi:hypothetical protein